MTAHRIPDPKDTMSVQMIVWVAVLLIAFTLVFSLTGKNSDAFAVMLIPLSLLLTFNPWRATGGSRAQLQTFTHIVLLAAGLVASVVSSIPSLGIALGLCLAAYAKMSLPEKKFVVGAYGATGLWIGLAFIHLTTSYFSSL